MFNRPCDLPIPFPTNCQVILDSCRTIKLSLRKHILNVQTDVLLGRLKKLGHLILGKPDGLLIHPHFQPRLAVFGLVEQDFSGGFWGSCVCILNASIFCLPH
jgi:hypothetical protein